MFVLMAGLVATLGSWAFIWLANTFSDWGLPSFGDAFFPWSLGAGVLFGLIMGYYAGTGEFDDED